MCLLMVRVMVRGELRMNPVTPASVARPSDGVVALARAGRKIEAIKLLREEKDLGLREAKEIVDAIPASGPSAGREDRGGMRLLLVGAVVVLIAAAAILL